MGKSLHNTTANGATKNVKDIKFWGNGDLFKLLSKASSEEEGWMKSTKAMEIEGVGCVVQVTTQQKNSKKSRFLTTDELEDKYPNSEDRPTYEQVNEADWVITDAVTFVPGVMIIEKFDSQMENVIERKLVAIH